MGYIQLIKWIGIGLILLSAFVGMPLMYSKWRDAERKTNEVAEYAKTRDQEVSYYKNELANQVASVKDLKLSRDAFNEIRSEYSELRKEFGDIKRNLKNVTQITAMTAKLIDTLQFANRDTTLIINNHPVAVKNFDYFDGYNYVEGYIIGDSTSLVMELIVPIKGVVTWKRDKFLGLRIGKKRYSFEATSSNPLVVLEELENIRIGR
jgi:hypothetical protein